MKIPDLSMGCFVLIALCLVFLVIPAKCDTAPPVPAPPNPSPVQIPWYAPLIGLGINAGLLGLKQIAPSIPGWAVPLINLGIGVGVSYLGGMGVNPTDWIANTAVISGTAFATHNIAKNVSRGDSFGTPSQPVR